MPYAWVEPEAFITYKGRTVYHAYNDSPDPIEYWYSASLCDEEGFEFDVRELPVPNGVTPDNHRLIVQSAIDAKLIKFPEESGDEGKAPAMIVASAWSDDHRVEVDFDACDYFAQASDDAICALAAIGWRGDLAADAVALHYQDKDYRLARLFHYLSVTALPEDHSGFECSVDRESAMAWLQKHREGLYWQVRAVEGSAVAIQASVEETLTITKFSCTYVEIEQADSEEAVLDAAYEAIYGHLAIDMESGWASESGSASGELVAQIGQEQYRRAI